MRLRASERFSLIRIALATARSGRADALGRCVQGSADLGRTITASLKRGADASRRADAPAEPLFPIDAKCSVAGMGAFIQREGMALRQSESSMRESSAMLQIPSRM